MVEDKSIAARIAEIERLAAAGQDMNFHEICLLAATVLHDTVGDAHPLVQAFREAKASTWGAKIETAAAVRTLLLIYRQGALGNPVLRVAKDVEGEILAIAEAQVRAAESSADTPSQQMRLGSADSTLDDHSIKPALAEMHSPFEGGISGPRTPTSPRRHALARAWTARQGGFDRVIRVAKKAASRAMRAGGASSTDEVPSDHGFWSAHNTK